MKAPKLLTQKKLLYFLAIVFLLELSRESNLLKLNYYHSTITSNLNANWSESSTQIEAKEGDELWKILVNDLDDSCKNSASLNRIAILTNIDGSYLSYNATNFCHGINLSSIHYSPGFTWTPLYKTPNFSGEFLCTIFIDYSVKTPTGILKKTIRKTGNITITGDASIKGLCSSAEAKLLIKKEVYKQIIQVVKKQIQQLN